MEVQKLKAVLNTVAERERKKKILEAFTQGTDYTITVVDIDTMPEWLIYLAIQMRNVCKFEASEIVPLITELLDAAKACPDLEYARWNFAQHLFVEQRDMFSGSYYGIHIHIQPIVVRAVSFCGELMHKRFTQAEIETVSNSIACAARSMESNLEEKLTKHSPTRKCLNSVVCLVHSTSHPASLAHAVGCIAGAYKNTHYLLHQEDVGYKRIYWRKAHQLLLAYLAEPHVGRIRGIK